MRLFDLMLKDLSQLIRDRQSILFLVVMPIVFTLMFGFAFGGFGGEQDSRLPVGVLDQDNGNLLSESLIELLDRSEVIRPVAWTDELGDLEKEVRNEDLFAAVIIPAGYTEQILRGEIISLEVVVDTASPVGLTTQSEIQTAVNRLLGAVQTAQISTQVYAQRVGFADEAEQHIYMEEALARTIAAWADPPLTVNETQALVEEKEEVYSDNAFSHSSPSMMVQFAISSLIGAAQILVLERKSKALQRLLTTAISRTEIILGHFLAMFVMILAQVVLLAGFGQLFLRLDYLREPLATLLIAVTMALWTAALGLLIGVLSKNEDQVISLSLTLMFVLAGVGGAWIPLEFTPKAFQTVGQLMPTAWAIDGFRNILVRGLGLSSVWLSAGVMLAYAVAIFGVAAWQFRFE